MGENEGVLASGHPPEIAHQGPLGLLVLAKLQNCLVELLNNWAPLVSIGLQSSLQFACAPQWWQQPQAGPAMSATQAMGASQLLLSPSRISGQQQAYEALSPSFSSQGQQVGALQSLMQQSPVR